MHSSFVALFTLIVVQEVVSKAEQFHGKVPLSTRVTAMVLAEDQEVFLVIPTQALFGAKLV